VPEVVAGVLVLVLTVYLAAGAVFALAFVSRGVNALDPRAASAGRGFRTVILPGTIIFWPVLMRRWLVRR
jgi:hypothetical protein